MTVTKQTISALLALGVAVAAHAGSVERSGEGSSTVSGGISKGIGNVSTSTFKSVEGSYVRSAASVVDGSRGMSAHSTYVIENPSGASANSADNTSRYTGWLLTKSGNVLHASFEGSVAVIKDPIGSSSTAFKASGRGLKVVWDSTGRVFTASGDVVSDVSGEPVDLVLDGSGEIYRVSEGSVIASVNGSTTALTWVGDSASGAVEFSKVKSVDFSRAVVASGRASKSVFSDENVENGDQFEKQK